MKFKNNLKSTVLAVSLALAFPSVSNAITLDEAFSFNHWKEAFNDSEEKYESESEAVSGMSQLTPAQRSVIENWDSIEEKFDDVFEMKDDLESAPMFAIFTSDKSDVEEDIANLYGKIFNIISDGEIANYQEQLEANNQAKAKEMKKLAALKRERSMSFDLKKKDSLTKDIVKIEDKIESIGDQRDELVNKIRMRLSDFGTDVTKEQVEALLTKVNATDILSMTTTFPVIAQFATYLGDITKDVDQDLVSAKKYYGMYVLLLALQLHIQNVYINNLTEEFIPSLDTLRDKSKKLILETKTLESGSGGYNVEVYKNNLVNQRFTLKAIELYKKQLNSNLDKIKISNKKLKRDYTAALNTYQTVDLSFNVSSLISANANLFQEVMKLQAPDLIPFENEKLRSEFEKLTLQMNSN